MKEKSTMSKSFILYQEYKKHIELLSLEQSGKLFKAIFDYNEGIEYDLEPIIKMAFSFIRADLDRNKEKYDNIVERNKINGSKGGRPSKHDKPSGLFGNQDKPKKADNDDDNDNVDDNDIIDIVKPAKKPKGFVRPTFQEVSDYCQERKNSVNPEKWINFYKSNGWKVGKNSMKDWKAAVRTWEGNSFGSSVKPQSKHNNFEEQDYYADTEGFLVNDEVS